MKNLKKLMVAGLLIGLTFSSVVVLGKNNRIVSNANSKQVINNSDDSIRKAYEEIENEEKYVIETINSYANTNYTRDDWKECLKYINDNYSEISNIDGIDMERINSYKLDYESVDRMNRNIECIPTGITRGSVNNFNPEKCRKYIEKYWDGKNRRYPYYDGKDCANFVSQCLYVYGYEMDDTWFCIDKEPSVPWINAQALTEYFSAKYNYVEDSAEAFLNRFDEYKVNVNEYDIIALRNKQGRVYHVMLVTKITEDDILYAGHTNNRIDRTLKGALVDSDENIRIVSTGNKGW